MARPRPTAALAALALWAGAASAQPDPVAWVVAHTGPAERILIRPVGGAAPFPLDPASPSLLEGETVAPGPGTSVELLLRAGGTVAVAAGDEWTARPRARAPGPLAGLLDWLFGRDEVSAPGWSRGGDGEPPVVARPRYGSVLSTRPRVAWVRSAPPSRTYDVRVVVAPGDGRCPDGGESVWEARGVRDSTAAHPARTGDLARDRRYRVEVRRGGADGYEDHGCFTVADEGLVGRAARARAVVEAAYGPVASSPAAGVVYAAALARLGLYSDAVDALDAVGPDGPAARRLRAHVYGEAGPPVLVPARR